MTFLDKVCEKTRGDFFIVSGHSLFRCFIKLTIFFSLYPPSGHSIAQVALRWLLQRDVTTSVIIGATSFAQLDDNMGAANGWSLSQEEVGLTTH